MDAVYFVVSEGDEPEKIYFSDEEAFASGAMYIDGFDEEGLKVISYKLQDVQADMGFLGTTSEEDYTTEF